MAIHLTQRPLIIQDENLEIHHKKAAVDGKTKSSKPSVKKGGVGFGSRKALHDITNRSTFHHEVSSRKKIMPKEGFNIAEEMFLHDHRKCIEAQQAAMIPCFFDTVFPEHDSVEFAESKPAKSDLDSPRCYPKPVELLMTEFSDLLNLKFSTPWDSPQSSPVNLDSPLPSPFAWKFEPLEFMLKEENDG